MLVATGSAGWQGLPWHVRLTRGRIQRSLCGDRKKHTLGPCGGGRAYRIEESVPGTCTYCLSQSPWRVAFVWYLHEPHRWCMYYTDDGGKRMAESRCKAALRILRFFSGLSN